MEIIMSDEYPDLSSHPFSPENVRYELPSQQKPSVPQPQLKKCNLCGLHSSFLVDGVVRGGSWALMCESCHTARGVGLGIGRGQSYQFVPGKGYIQLAGGSQPGKRASFTEGGAK